MQIPTLEKINEFESDPQKIIEAIKGLADKQLNFNISSDEWNINQIIVHLADTEMFFYGRIRKVIVEDNPLIQSFNQDDWANRLFYDKQEYAYALELLVAQRKSTATLLRLLSDDMWKRKGIKEGKTITLFDIFTTALHHIPTHLQQITTIKNSSNFPTK